MADPGVSTQNFLRLLLGGAQRGADVFQQRQTQQQAQAPDLFMALENMMRQKAEREQDVKFRQEGRDLEVGQIREQRNRQFGLDMQNAFQQMRQNAMAQQQLGLQRQETEAQVASAKALTEERQLRIQQEKDAKKAYGELTKQYPKLGPYFAAVQGGADPRALGPLISSLESITGNETLDKMLSKGLDDLMRREDDQGNPVPVTPEEIQTLIGNIKETGKQFEKTADGVAEPANMPAAVTEKIRTGGRLSAPEALTAIGINELFIGEEKPEDRARVLLTEGLIDTQTYSRLLSELRKSGPGAGDAMQSLFRMVRGAP